MSSGRGGASGNRRGHMVREDPMLAAKHKCVVAVDGQLLSYGEEAPSPRGAVRTFAGDYMLGICLDRQIVEQGAGGSRYGCYALEAL